MRLIDADALIAFLKKLGRFLKVEENHKQKCRLIGNIINYIEKRAAINPADLVPVVRCGLCRYEGTDDCPMSGTPGRVSASDFCSYGERAAEGGGPYREDGGAEDVAEG